VLLVAVGVVAVVLLVDEARHGGRAAASARGPGASPEPGTSVPASGRTADSKAAGGGNRRHERSVRGSTASPALSPGTTGGAAPSTSAPAPPPPPTRDLQWAPDAPTGPPHDHDHHPGPGPGPGPGPTPSSSRSVTPTPPSTGPSPTPGQSTAKPG
jgi:hypothetical protein